MAKKLIHPETKGDIVGTLETVPGIALIEQGEGPNGFEIDGVHFCYAGSTTVLWDDQKTVLRDGKRVFVDEGGDQTTEPQLVDEDDEEEEVSPAGEKLWLVVITHKHGEDRSLHRTKAGADAVVRKYIKEWWGDRADSLAPAEFPEDWGTEDLVSSYFDDNETEFLEREELTVDG